MKPNQMKTNIEKHMNELIPWLKKTAGEIGTVARQETPLIMKEYIRWTIWENMFRTFVPILFLAPSVTIFLLSVVHVRVHDGDLHGGALPILLTATFGIASVASGICLAVNLWERSPLIIKAIVAPRIIILEKIRELTRKY